ncbi:MAG: hypothetical protein LRY73_12300 [Bacillus sp. (in: Bacteria)]|nr:hypothetical protein [Bacillus sp. (in: firmicutes)]
MDNIADKVHIGELIAISKVFQLNTFEMVTKLENGSMEVFDRKEDFYEKYGEKETYDELLDWCELNNGKIFTILQ